MNQKVSVILPVWNGEAFLDQALDSLRMQSYSNLEIVIVDDCSTDSTPVIIERHRIADKRIVVVRNEKNLKLPMSLNIGFLNSTGEWISWTSYDNVHKRDHICTLLNEVTFRQFELGYGNYEIIDENSKLIKCSEVQDPINLVRGNCVGASFIYHRSVHERLGGYDETKFMFEDYDFWVRAFLSGVRMGCVSGNNYQYRIHLNQLSIRRSLPLSFLEYRRELIEYRWNCSKKLKASALLDFMQLAEGYGARREMLWAALYGFSLRPIWVLLQLFAGLYRRLHRLKIR